MDVEKEKIKITNKDDLELVLSFMNIDDDWLARPIFKTPEELRRYEEYLDEKKLEIAKKNYDICIEEGEEYPLTCPRKLGGDPIARSIILTIELRNERMFNCGCLERHNRK